MFKKVRVKEITEKSFENRDDNYIIASKETIVRKFLGITYRTLESYENLVSIEANEKEKTSVKKKKSIGFNVEK